MRHVAGFFPADEYENVLVGLNEPDDAAVYQLDDTRALIKTTDFFTPIVDDPWTYGAIAAANSMSDVYAMGGEVILCLNIAGFPEDLSPDIIGQIIAGGANKVQEAGGVIAGGHTVTNPEPFYGLSVTGMVHPENVIRKGGARPGDQLYLTKPLGTGIVTTAAKLTGKPDLDPAHLEAAIGSMARLNKAGAQAAQMAKVRGGSDITGFGLLGHGSEIAVASGQNAGATLRIAAEKVPALPGVWEYIDAGYLTRGSQRNPEHFGQHVQIASNVTSAQRTLLWEAETSGGLFLSVPADEAQTFEATCAERDQNYWHIGDVISGEGMVDVV
ncbi:selenide, water dikinase SelD [Chloroflexi bacterium TSY]|nr:selenide, water dikinase SelD [Chloroflexi bacterium TSY]